MTFKETPLGDIFMDTDIQLIGYPLPRESSPYCNEYQSDLNMTIEEYKTQCFGQSDWGDLDFEVDSRVILKAIELFVLNRTSDCNKYLSQVGEKEYVLYNVHCQDSGVDDDSATFNIRHFFWPKEVDW